MLYLFQNDKGPIANVLTAWDAMAEGDWLQKLQCENHLDFEEEQGSPSFAEAVIDYKAKLAAESNADYGWPPRHTSKWANSRYGARGNLRKKKKWDQTYYLWTRNFHSIAGALGQLCTKSRDSLWHNSLGVHEGRRMAGNYILANYELDRITASEKAIFASVPRNDEAAINKRLGLAETDQSWARPSREYSKKKNTPL